MRDEAFRKHVLDYWRRHGRHELPWRKTTDPYHILVSEVMLQQTQVDRVIPKYLEFFTAFPTFRALSRAPVARVLKVWQGLGYNRRALMLQRCAEAVVSKHGGRLPEEYDLLIALPGIGPYTAGAVSAFAFNIARPMIETNIRRVYIHHFFPGKKNVSDAQLLPVVERTMDIKNARRWYSALMDYGTYLVTQTENPNTRSRHYVRQAKFEGSDRKVRGAILRALVTQPRLIAPVLAQEVQEPVARVRNLLLKLEKEGFIARCKHTGCVHNPHWALRGR